MAEVGGVKRLVNINLGVLGHVDSGKTSLCKALSTTASTAAFDSNPQSKERGITLDLGFSLFTLEDRWSLTLVDCPGHASLIRTVLGGVQIMDIMLLVIDVKKGMQPQTAECLILANICCSNLIVVLNKVDLIEKNIRAAKIEKLRRLMGSTLAKTKFLNEPIVCVSATDPDIGTSELKAAIVEKLEKIKITRMTESPFLMAVDHCFTIKGSGAVCTGTIIQGQVKIGDTVEFPELMLTKKVKSMQIFKSPVNQASAGDRLALGIPGLDSKLVERGIISSPGLIKAGTRAGIIELNRIQYYNPDIESRQRYHVTIGYSTVTAMITLFGEHLDNEKFDRSRHYHIQLLLQAEKTASAPIQHKSYFALLEFDKPIMMIPNALVIGSDLQHNNDENTCRLAFSGAVVESNHDKDYKETYLPQLKIFHWKTKSGNIDRIVSSSALIAKGFCKRLSNIDHLLGLKVSVLVKLPDKSYDNSENGEVVASGRIESRFGQTDKVRIAMESPLSEEQLALINANIKVSQLELKYKKFLFKDSKENSSKQLVQ